MTPSLRYGRSRPLLPRKLGLLVAACIALATPLLAGASTSVSTRSMAGACRGVPTTIAGTAADDRITGTAGEDVIDGGSGTNRCIVDVLENDGRRAGYPDWDYQDGLQPLR